MREAKRFSETLGFYRVVITPHKFYASPNIIRVIKSRRMRLVGHIARMGQMRSTYKMLLGIPEGKTSLRGPRGS
jgi:hypothetical protein